MMGNLEYDDNHMDEITNQYNQAVAVIDDMIEYMNNMLNLMSTTYEGQAENELIPETFSKIIQHLELLKLCYYNTGIFVTNTKNTLAYMDSVQTAVLNFIASKED